MPHHTQLAHLSLWGNFTLTDAKGRPIQVVEKKGRALLAMVAMDPDMKRSRQWLKSKIWCRSGEPQCSYSLRQCLFKLRAIFGDELPILEADREFVSLRGVSLKRPSQFFRNGEFFEDAPNLDMPFQEWLMGERLGNLGGRRDNLRDLPALGSLNVTEKIGAFSFG